MGYLQISPEIDKMFWITKGLGIRVSISDTTKGQNCLMIIRRLVTPHHPSYYSFYFREHMVICKLTYSQLGVKGFSFFTFLMAFLEINPFLIISINKLKIRYKTCRNFQNRYFWSDTFKSKYDIHHHVLA